MIINKTELSTQGIKLHYWMWHTSELDLLCDLGYVKTMGLSPSPSPKTTVICLGTKQDTVH